MTRRERETLKLLIEWAVAPEPPLPALADTDAVLALARNFEHGPLAQRLGLRAALVGLELLPLFTGERQLLCRVPRDRRARVLTALERGPLAPLGQALAALAQLAYYGDLEVMRGLGYDPDRIRARGRALRTAEARW